MNANLIAWLLGATALVTTIQIVLLARTLRMVGLIRRYEEKLAHFGDALALLTETTESGFRAVALEVERLGAGAATAADAKTTNARVATAVRRGRSIQQVAADEQVSEGEVRLRLHLAEQTPPRGRRREKTNGTVRA